MVFSFIRTVLVAKVFLRKKLLYAKKLSETITKH